MGMVARDRLGNETSATIPLDLSGKVRPAIRLALAGSGESSLDLASSATGKDTRPPEIKLKGWTDSQTVFLDKIYIEGQVVDEGTVESLTINKVPVLRTLSLMCPSLSPMGFPPLLLKSVRCSTTRIGGKGTQSDFSSYIDDKPANLIQVNSFPTRIL